MRGQEKSVGAAIAAAGFARGVVDVDKPRIYLAGPMSGVPDLNYPAFDAEAARLRRLGYHVENPAETPKQKSWHDYMRHAIAKMMTCDELALLPNYNLSEGAMMEFGIADRLGMQYRMSHAIVEPACGPASPEDMAFEQGAYEPQ